MHWVIIETGGNQRYLFDTNRLRHAVGASQLVWETTNRWLPDAIHDPGRREGRIEEVMVASGRAHLLVDDEQVGRELIRRLSLWVLEEAPGLQLTGVVGPRFDPTREWCPAHGDDPDVFVGALRATLRRHAQARAARPPVELRDPMLPWLEPCRESGLPAMDWERELPRDAARHPVSAAVHAKHEARQAGRTRVADVLRTADEPPNDDPVPSPNHLDKIDDDGWLAVVHADGDSVGRVFRRFPERLHALYDDGPITWDLYRYHLRAFSGALTWSAEAALRAAVVDVRKDRDVAAKVLPLVVGGDDLTLACAGSLARPLVTAYLRHFERETGQREEVREILEVHLSESCPGEVGRGRLTASAGIAYVKPHHPFSAAYQLAEELASRAKQVRGSSAFDLHVCFDSTLAPVDELRAVPSPGRLQPWGGPYLVAAAPVDGREAEPVPSGVDTDEDLDEALAAVAQISSSALHDLREALACSTDEYRRRLHHITTARDSTVTNEGAALLRPRPRTGVDPDGAGTSPPDGRVLLLDAMLLDTLEARPRQDTDTATRPEPAAVSA